MGDSFPAVCAGTLLIAVGVGLGWFQWRFRRPQADDDPLAHRHAQRQLVRRLQVSGLMVLVGILIPLGDLLPVFRRAPLVFALYWVAILCLMLWIMLLALGDFAAARAFHSRAQRQLLRQQSELERQLNRLRSSGNGHAGSVEKKP